MTNPTLAAIENNTPVTTEPMVLGPQVNEQNPWSISMDDLRKAAFDQPTEPVAQPQSPEPYTLQQGPDGIQVTLSPEFGGEVFKGKDFNEVIAKLAKSKADGNAYIKQLKTQPGTQPNAQQLPTPAPQQVTEQDAAQARQFIRELAGLTPEYEQELAKRGLANVLGVDAQVLPQTLQGIASTVGEFQANNTLFEFQARCPDYLDTPENASALQTSLVNMLGVDPQELAQTGYAPTVDDLEVAYARAVYRKQITPHVPQAQPVQAARPAPMPNAGATPNVATGQSAWSMPMDQLAALAGIE